MPCAVIEEFFPPELSPSCPQPTPGSLSSCILTITLCWSKAFPNPEQYTWHFKGILLSSTQLVTKL